MADNINQKMASKELPDTYHAQKVCMVDELGNVLEDGLADTATPTSVADNSSAVTILAANTARIGATVFNDSSALLYLLLGTGTPSSTNYTAKVFSNGYYEVPKRFTGIIKGIWASDPGDGAARVTELT